MHASLACFSMSGVSGVSGALANGNGSVVVGTDQPVFSDDSGRRAAVLKWGVGAICIIAVLFGGALVLTLGTHVPLPGVDRLSPPPGGQLGGEAAMPAAQESPSQAPQPSIAFQPSPTPTSASRQHHSATKPSARSTTTVRRAAPPTTRTSRPTATPQATPSTSTTTKARNPQAATPSPRGSRPTSKPGNGPG